MTRDSRFDDIRPYYEEELPAAMQRIAQSEEFPLLSSFVYPGVPVEKVRQKISSFTTHAEFQLDTMRCVNEQVITRSISQFSYSGFEQLDPSVHYLYVSNHRDIMLDSCLFQYALYKNGFETSEITFGANLMISPLIIDIGKSNKMFKVERPGGSIKDFYRSSFHLSEYIRHTIQDKGQSIWIAQRNGRTKDGNDHTDQGIIKMFGMSRADKKGALEELHIVPLAISYEWESCDLLKTIELYQSSQGPYKKQPGEDLNSILTGVKQWKGNVHIEVCAPLEKDFFDSIQSLNTNEYHQQVAAKIDEEIHSGYRLFKNNYIAYDLLYGTDTYSAFYTHSEKSAFCERVQLLEQFSTYDIEKLKEIFLKIYAYPVVNKHYNNTKQE